MPELSAYISFPVKKKHKNVESWTCCTVRTLWYSLSNFRGPPLLPLPSSSWPCGGLPLSSSSSTEAAATPPGPGSRAPPTPLPPSTAVIPIHQRLMFFDVSMSSTEWNGSLQWIIYLGRQSCYKKLATQEESWEISKSLKENISRN